MPIDLDLGVSLEIFQLSDLELGEVQVLIVQCTRNDRIHFMQLAQLRQSVQLPEFQGRFDLLIDLGRYRFKVRNPSGGLSRREILQGPGRQPEW